ncbi:NUDIX domain-containing protein [Kitasatospora sp. GP30]|uniref:NUDIX domain-containing protein n=1 Tax=Kitasatospora sp. GP30 TaxID=3035084 RepID=UPI0024759E73|nr:NUDIX domain-containing protein [Kitasatospora sp. GP30]
MTSRLAVSVIVHDLATGLIVTVRYGRRAWNPEPVFTIPGGKVDPGESADEAGVRELREETGLVVERADLRLVHVAHVAQGWDKEGEFLLLAFAAIRWSGQPVNAEPKKHLAVGWAPLTDLPEPMFPTSRAAITAYRDGGPRFAATGWPGADHAAETPA